MDAEGLCLQEESSSKQHPLIETKEKAEGNGRQEGQRYLYHANILPQIIICA